MTYVHVPLPFRPFTLQFSLLRAGGNQPSIEQSRAGAYESAPRRPMILAPEFQSEFGPEQSYPGWLKLLLLIGLPSALWLGIFAGIAALFRLLK